MIAPGSTIGIVGGGQLGRMLALAAAQLGYQTCVYAPDDEGPHPAMDVASQTLLHRYDDEGQLAQFADWVDVVTFEFENVPVGTARFLARHVPVRPGPRAFAIAQDRLLEKEFAIAHGGRTAPFGEVDTLADLDAALARIGVPAILKTRRLGYDGKGQVHVARLEDSAAAWAEIERAPSLLEGVVPFDAEFSIILARGVDGSTAVYDATLNEHRAGILHRSTVPAGPLVEPHVAEAVALARRLAAALDYVGVLAVEFFATPGGPVFNEMAPRVHNSGHWTIEGARTSQFENHIRAICGLPLGPPDTRVSCVMTNLIGDEIDDWPRLAADATASLHLYGKQDARPGRKMGHVTRF